MEKVRVLPHDVTVRKRNLGKIVRPIRIISLYNMLNLKDSDWSYFSVIPTVMAGINLSHIHGLTNNMEYAQLYRSLNEESSF